MIWYDMVWYNMIWYGTVWYDIILYDIIWYDYIIMGPPSYMWSVVDRNIVMRLRPVLTISRIFTFGNIVMSIYFLDLRKIVFWPVTSSTLRNSAATTDFPSTSCLPYIRSNVPSAPFPSHAAQQLKKRSKFPVIYETVNCRVYVAWDEGL